MPAVGHTPKGRRLRFGTWRFAMASPPSLFSISFVSPPPRLQVFCGPAAHRWHRRAEQDGLAGTCVAELKFRSVMGCYHGTFKHGSHSRHLDYCHFQLRMNLWPCTACSGVLVSCKRDPKAPRLGSRSKFINMDRISSATGSAAAMCSLHPS